MYAPRWRCLRQVITEQPTPWMPLPDPFTMAGNEQAANYTVAADFRVEAPGYVTLMTRIDSGDVFSHREALLPSGYVLKVHGDGKWTPASAESKKPIALLASGVTKVQSGSWHSFTLTANGDRIVARLDTGELARIHSTAHTHGMFAIGTGWNEAQFDNLSVTPVK